MAKRKFTLPDPDRQIVDEFILRTGGTEASREVHTSLIELVVGEIGKPIPKITDLDILKERDTILKSSLKPNYKRKMIFNLKRFFLWYWETKGIKKYDISGVRLPAAEWKSKNPDDMLSPQDIETLLKACHNARDRCFVAMQWDASSRPVELLLLKWQDLKSDEYGYSFKTSAKTGKERHIRLTISIPYIEAWKREYPGEPTGKNPVFVTLRRIQGEHKAWTMDSVKFMFETLRTETGLKNFKPGTIRPSRITDDVGNGYGESYLKMKNWGNLKTPMLDKYVNLRPDFIDKEALKRAGMTRKADTAPEAHHFEITVPTCPTCQTLNIPGTMFCGVCRGPLNEAAKAQQERERGSLNKAMLVELERMQKEIDLLKATSTKQ